jgi:hypothetical protein
VDDVVVKTRDSSTLIDDLEETFASLREYRWKLNPNKCVFGVSSGKLLGFIISQRGIEANPEKISAITSMKAPTSIKDVQKLTGCMAALNRFISRLGEQGLPFFKLLKHQEKFVWTPEADQTLCWRVTRKIRMDPRTRVREREFLARSNKQLEGRETVILLADGTSSKKSESVYTCSCAPLL